MDDRETKTLRVVKTRRTVPLAGITDINNQGSLSPVSKEQLKDDLRKKKTLFKER